MLSIAVCDDEPIIAHQIESYLLEIQNSYYIKIETLDIFYSTSELYDSLLNEIFYDIIYLDIKMPQKNGIEIAHLIRKKHSKSIFIFVSGYEQYWKELFEVEAFRFINKPIDKELFQKYFLAAIDKIKKEDLYYNFTYKYCTYKIPISDILYFESNGRYIIIHLLSGIKELRGKLNDIEIELNNINTQFLRIHKSYLVSYKHILCMSRSQVKMADGTLLPISYEKQKSIRIQFTSMLGGLNDY